MESVDPFSKGNHQDVVQNILVESGYKSMLQNDKSLDSAAKLDNLNEFIDALSNFDNIYQFLDFQYLLLH